MFRKRGVKNKKALGAQSDMYFIVTELILLMMIAFAINNYITGIANNTMFERNFYARDLALLTHTVYAAPGDLTYNYNGKISQYNFTVEMADGKVKVARQGSTYYSAYHYAEDLNFKQPPKISRKKVDWLTFRKTGDTIEVLEQLATKQKTRFSYPDIDTAGEQSKQNIVFDFSKLKGYGSNKLDMSDRDAARQVFHSFRYLKEDDFFGLNKTNATIPASANVVFTLTFHTGPKNGLTAYYNNKKSRKMASILINKLSSNPEIRQKIDSSNVIEPNNMDFQKGPVHVILDLGSVTVEKEKNLMLEGSAIAESISSAIEEYFSGYKPIVNQTNVNPVKSSGAKHLIKTKIIDDTYVDQVFAVVGDKNNEPIKPYIMLEDEGMTGDDSAGDGVYGNSCNHCLSLSEGKYYVNIYVDYKGGREDQLVPKESYFVIE